MKKIVFSVACAVVAALSTGCGGGSSSGNAQVEACVNRGIAYFKEIGLRIPAQAGH